MVRVVLALDLLEAQPARCVEAALRAAERLAEVQEVEVVTALAGNGGLRRGVTIEQAVDIVWVLVSPRSGSCWSTTAAGADYREWLERTLIDAVLPAS